MSRPGSVGHLLEVIVGAAKRCANDMPVQIERDAHMNGYRGPLLERVVTDAVIVAFCNRVAAEQGADLALYTKDL